MAKFRYMAFVLFLFIFWTTTAWAAEATDVKPGFTGVITKTPVKLLAIAVPDFMTINPGDAAVNAAGLDLPYRLTDNLELTGIFTPLPKQSFMEANPRAGVSPGTSVNFSEWTKVGAQFLVKGGYQLAGAQLTLELRLYEVAGGKMMIGKRYVGALPDGRTMINRFTNEILLAITGEAGVFGSKIAFVSGTMSNKSVMMTEFGGGTVSTIAAGNGPSTQPAVSPRGDVAYIHRNGASWELKMGNQVISAGPLHLSPAFTPSGALAAAISGKFDTNIYRFGGPGTKPTPITDHWGINISPTFSPDGRMAFVSNRGGDAQIYVSSADGGPAKLLTTMGKQNTDPHWSPRGDRIVFCTDETDIASINPDGSDPQKLTSGMGVNTRPTFSPDGRLIAFASTREGRSQIYIMSANGAQQRALMPEYTGDQRNPFWSPVKPDGSSTQ